MADSKKTGGKKSAATPKSTKPAAKPAAKAKGGAKKK